ncbi:hypothetical protein Droror1_Dr00003382 [Drosera rotundifolia]
MIAEALGIDITEALSIDLPNRLPKNFTTEVDVMIGMTKILDKAKVSLMKVIIAQEHDEYPDMTEVHWIVNFHIIMKKCRDELLSKGKERDTEGNFLMQEIQILEKAKTKVAEHAFFDMVGRKVDDIVPRLNAFVGEFWSYMANLVDIFLEKTLVGYSMQLGYIDLCGEILRQSIRQIDAESIPSASAIMEA